MTDYKTLRIPEDAWETAQETKRETETWGDFIQRCSENPPPIREFVEADATSGDAPEGMSEQLDRIEAAAKEATNAAQSAERTMEQLK